MVVCILGMSVESVISASVVLVCQEVAFSSVNFCLRCPFCLYTIKIFLYLVGFRARVTPYRRTLWKLSLSFVWIPVLLLHFDSPPL